MSGHVDVRLPHILSCLPLRTFWLYYPPIPFLQQVIAVLWGEWCLTLWNVSHVKTDRIMFESSLIKVLTVDVEHSMFDCLAEMSWNCEAVWGRQGSKWRIKSDDRNFEIRLHFSSWMALFSTVLFLDTEVTDNPPSNPDFQTLVLQIHMGGFVSRSHKEGANIKAYHIVLIAGLQPVPLFYGLPGISVFNWA